MDYVIAIPTFRRYELLSLKTLKMLKDNNIPKEKIYIFVADDEEYQKYQEATQTDLYGTMITGVVGLVHQRQFITDFFDEGQHIFTCDDDLDLFDLTLMPEYDLDGFIKYAFSECINRQVHIFGIYACYNPFFMAKRPVTTEYLAYICGYCYGYINKKCNALKLKITSHQDICGEKEDFERTVLYYLMDGKTLRFNRVACKTKYYNTVGGLGTRNERIERANMAVGLLCVKYNGFGKLVYRKNGMPEWKLNRKMKLAMDSFYD